MTTLGKAWKIRATSGSRLGTEFKIGVRWNMNERMKIRKNSLTENLYLDRQGHWVPWRQAAWFNSERAAEDFAHRHGVDVFGLFPCESYGTP
jgi:hypothetical protein